MSIDYRKMAFFIFCDTFKVRDYQVFRRYFDYHRIVSYGKGDVCIRKAARFRLPLYARLTFLFLHSGKDGFCALVSRTKEKGSPFGLPQ
jgi:hypothetical protein